MELSTESSMFTDEGCPIPVPIVGDLLDAVDNFLFKLTGVLAGREPDPPSTTQLPKPHTARWPKILQLVGRKSKLGQAVQDG